MEVGDPTLRKRREGWGTRGFYGVVIKLLRRMGLRFCGSLRALESVSV
jgi:hypothetical protein